MMQIEFTGIPCSGKSEISHELAALLRAEGYSVCEKQYEGSHTQGTAKRVASKLLALAAYTFRHPCKALSLYKQFASQNLFVNYTALRAHRCKADVCLLEQGYLQLLGSFFDEKEWEAERAMQLSKLVLPNEPIVQIVVSVSKETALKRARQRKDKPFYLLARKPEAALEQALSIYDHLLELWQARGEAPCVITVSNDEENGQQLAAQRILKDMKQKGLL